MTKSKQLNNLLREKGLSDRYQVRYSGRYGNFYVYRIADGEMVGLLGGVRTDVEQIKNNLLEFLKTDETVRNNKPFDSTKMPLRQGGR